MNQARTFITRPKEQSKNLSALLSQKEIVFTLAPALAIQPVEQSLSIPKAGDIGIFVSSNAVRSYFANNSWPKSVYACAVGKSTAKELNNHIPANQILAPDEDSNSDSEALLKVIDGLGLEPHTAHIYRAQTGRNWLSAQLVARGWQVKFYAVYSRNPIIWDYSVCFKFAYANPAILLLTSKDAFGAINASLKSYNLSWPDKLYLITLHKRIAACLEQIYSNSDKILNVAVTKPDDDSMFRAIYLASNSFHKF